ncbi:hypothetical protein HF086_002230 [Spodoptera exigua]|uniref:Tetraspanin n=1 Tax=Spodoptera exigua TaxID=7107 RepID=A0A922MS40_SPOEX|nr:hypothetical protein HF086_002230 [Spodoptera exigua]
MAEEKKKDASALLAKKKKVKPRKSRDADCCSVNFLKCVLHIFNVVFLFAGAGVLGVGAWTVTYRHRYVSLLPTPTYPAIAYLLIIAGAMGVPLCALGCCGLKTENRTSLLCYTYFLLITFLLEVGAGGLAYYYEVAVEDELRADALLGLAPQPVARARPAPAGARLLLQDSLQPLRRQGPSLQHILSWLHTTVHEPHTGPPDHIGSGGGGDGSDPYIRVPVLVRAVCENKARDRLTAGCAGQR